MRNVFFTLAVSGLTLVDASTFLTSRTLRARLVAALHNAEVSSYWLDRYEPLSEPMKSAFREPLLNKLSGFVTDPVSRHLLGQQRSTLDFARAMSERKWILVNLSKGRLRDNAHTLGNLIFAKLQFDVMARAALPEHDRPVFSIFCDEVQNIAENDLVVLFAEGRKYGASLFTANQFWEQLPRELRGALLSAGSHILFRLSAHDASTLAAELSPGGRNRILQQLTAIERGQAIVRVGSAQPELISIPHLPSKRSVIPIQQLRNIALARYARPRADVEADIRARREPHAPAPEDEPKVDLNYSAERHGQDSW